MLKAEDYLQALPAQRGVDQLHHVLQQWRAAGTLADKHAHRNQLRQVAAELGVPLIRGERDDPGTVSSVLTAKAMQRACSSRRGQNVFCMLILPRRPRRQAMHQQEAIQS